MTGEQILEYFITAQLGEAQKLCHQIEAVMMTRLRLVGDVVRTPGRPRGSRNKAKVDAQAPLIEEGADSVPTDGA